MTVLQTIREIVREQVEYRELLLQMTRRDLLLRYKQTVMGFGWAIFMPLVNTVVFSVIFTRVAPIETGVPYPLFAFCGLLVWNFFASSLRFAVDLADRATASLVHEGLFSAGDLPVLGGARVRSSTCAVGSLVLVGADGLLPHRRSRRRSLFLPAGPGRPRSRSRPASALILAMANLFYRDVKYLFEVRAHGLDVRDVGGLSDRP